MHEEGGVSRVSFYSVVTKISNFVYYCRLLIQLSTFVELLFHSVRRSIDYSLPHDYHSRIMIIPCIVGCLSDVSAII